MKFAKENMTLLICGGVALLFLVFAFAPIPYAVPSLRQELIDEVQQRYGVIADIKAKAKEPLVLPGLPIEHGIPPESWVKAKHDMITNINDQQKAVEQEAQDGNARGRVEAQDVRARGPVAVRVPLLPIPSAANLASSTGKRMPGFLPKTTAEPMSFKNEYGRQFRLWTGLLAYGTLTEVDDDSTMPPKADRLKAKFDAQEAAKALNRPNLGATPGALVNTGQSQREFWDFEKSEIMNRASGLHMYVEQTAFQKRAWLTQDDSPKEQQIFEAFVDSWFQSDLVKAISAVNSQPKYDVGKAPIKRLTRVVIGNNARVRYLNTGTASATPGPGVAAGDPGPIFLTHVNSTTGTEVTGGVQGPSVAAGNQGIAAPANKSGYVLPETANATDYLLGMTGRSAGHSYDVAYMSVVMDMDPAALFNFIDKFYRQNMGYTMVNVQCRTVDPLERTSTGYLYGNGQVVEVEILFECILFRSWTDSIMPDDVKRDLGGTAPAGG